MSQQHSDTIAATATNNPMITHPDIVGKFFALTILKRGKPYHTATYQPMHATPDAPTSDSTETELRGVCLLCQHNGNSYSCATMNKKGGGHGSAPGTAINHLKKIHGVIPADKNSCAMAADFLAIPRKTVTVTIDGVMYTVPNVTPTSIYNAIATHYPITKCDAADTTPSAPQKAKKEGDIGANNDARQNTNAGQQGDAPQKAQPSAADPIKLKQSELVRKFYKYVSVPERRGECRLCEPYGLYERDGRPHSCLTARKKSGTMKKDGSHGSSPDAAINHLEKRHAVTITKYAEAEAFLNAASAKA